MNQVSRPDLAVIDEAIRRIRVCWNTYTCIALRQAAIELRQAHLATEYVTQYRKHILSGQRSFPNWWNSSYCHQKDRIAALESFRDACINAGKKEAA